nr:immunoglobulin heavy chain junction region [Macaca mulatta]
CARDRIFLLIDVAFDLW